MDPAPPRTLGPPSELRNRRNRFRVCPLIPCYAPDVVLLMPPLVVEVDIPEFEGQALQHWTCCLAEERIGGERDMYVYVVSERDFTLS